MTDVVSDEIYPNSPLVEVVYEVRFRGDMQVQCQMDRLWAELRSEYPKIHVPGPGAKPQPAPYRWENEDATCGIMVGINRLSYFAREYPGFARFSEAFSRAHELFMRCFPAVDVSTRRGWRYINLIPFVRGSDQQLPIDFYLQHPPADSSACKGPMVQLDTKSVSLDGSLRQLLHVQSVRTERDSTDAFRLDIDCALEAPGTFADAASEMEILHRRGREVFEELITNEYRQYLRGDDK